MVTRRLQSLALRLRISSAKTLASLLAVALMMVSPKTLHAGKCDALFISTIGSFEGPVRVAYESGLDVPFDVQYALVKLSEVADGTVLKDQAANQVVPKTRQWARRVFIFTGKRNTAELVVSRAGRGWFIKSVATSLLTGKTRSLAADAKVTEQTASHQVDDHLALHMRAIRNLFRIEFAVERDDFIGPILSWSEASGESPLRGSLVELFLAYRHQSFHLGRGFEHEVSAEFSEAARRKMAAIALLVEKRLMFSLGFDGEPAGLFRQVGSDKWERVSTAYDRPVKDPALLLFQAMANAGFVYESGIYRNRDGS